MPSRKARTLLAVVIFPLGRQERPPGDRLGHKVAQLLLSPSATRARLTDGVFISDNSDNPVGLLEMALPRVIATEPLERRLAKAQSAGRFNVMNHQNQLEDAVAKSIITPAEARELKTVREMVAEIVAVDEFESSYLKRSEGVKRPPVSDQAA